MERLQEFFDVHKIEKCTYTELSASDGNKRKSLIYSEEKEAYSFDQITRLFFPKIWPSSADAILFKGETRIYLIEFKSGFEREKFDLNKCKCDYKGNVCEDYAELFKRSLDNINRELQANLFQKATESRWILEKHLLPQICSDEEQIEDIKVYFDIVIDKVKDNPIDAMEEIMDGLAGQAGSKEKSSNIYVQMQQSLKKIFCENCFTGKPSFYNKAEVLSKEEFEQKFLKHV